MPLELIKEVKWVPEVQPLNKLQKLDFRPLQTGCDYSKMHIQVSLLTQMHLPSKNYAHILCLVSVRALRIAFLLLFFHYS